MTNHIIYFAENIIDTFSILLNIFCSLKYYGNRTINYNSCSKFMVAFLISMQTIDIYDCLNDKIDKYFNV